MGRWMSTVASVGVMTVVVASPAQAESTVRALWNMDAVPTMVDSAGGDNNGKTTAVTMSPDGFYTFDGTSSIVSVPHKANLNPGAAAIKVEVKLNVAAPPANGESYDVIRKGTSKTATGYYKIELKGTSSGMNAACIFKDRNKVVGTAIASIPSQTWLTITCTKTATTVGLAVNGTTKKTTTKTVGEITNTVGVFLGGKGDGTDVFSGLMDSASITIG